MECETRPNMRRLEAKNSRSAWFQPRVLGQGSIRRILAVPQGKLKAVDMKVRGAWEVWVVGSSAPLEKYPSLRR